MFLPNAWQPGFSVHLPVTLTRDVSASDLTGVRARVCDDRADLIWR